MPPAEFCAVKGLSKYTVESKTPQVKFPPRKRIAEAGEPAAFLVEGYVELGKSRGKNILHIYTPNPVDSQPSLYFYSSILLWEEPMRSSFPYRLLPIRCPRATELPSLVLLRVRR